MAFDTWTWIDTGQTSITNVIQTVAPPTPVVKPAKPKKVKTVEELLKEQEAYLNKIYGSRSRKSSDRYSDPEIYI